MTTSSAARSLALFALVVLVFSRSFGAGAVWDDDLLIRYNDLFLKPYPLYAIWCTTQPIDYNPLTLTMFWLERGVFGMDLVGYHVVNVLLHATGVVLVGRVLAALEVPGAWFAALVFGVSPLSVGSATWISQGKNTLSLVLLALSTLCWLGYDDDPSRGRMRWASAALYLLAMLAKTSGLLLPVVLMACSWWRGRLDRARLRALLPHLAVAVAMAGVTVWFQHHRAMHEAGPAMDVSLRLATAGWVFWFYVVHAVIPVPVMAIYPYTVPAADRLVFPPFGEMTVASPLVWVPDLLLAACLALALRARWRGLLFALVCALALSAPVLGLVGMAYWLFAIVSDHLGYLASIPAIAFLMAGIWRLPRPPLIAAAVACLMAVGSYTWQAAWRDAPTLWTDTLAKNPNAWAARLNIGSHLESQGRPAEALEAYKEAARLHPEGPNIWYDMGHAYIALGRHDDAVAAYQQMLRLDPENPAGHNNLAVALQNLGRRGEAATHYYEALRLWPDYAQAHCNLGMLLADDNRLALAEQHLREAVRLSPGNNPQAYAHLASVLLQRGQLAEAVPLLTQSVKWKPDDLDAWRNLGAAHVALKQWPEADAALQQARRLDARDARVRYFSAVTRGHLGAPREALQHFEAAEQADPGYALAFNDHAWMLATHPDASVRDGRLAVRLAEQACTLSGWTDGQYLDTLAAALAETGDFTKAVEIEARAIQLDEQNGEASLAAEARTHLGSWRAGRPWRE